MKKLAVVALAAFLAGAVPARAEKVKLLLTGIH